MVPNSLVGPVGDIFSGVHLNVETLHLGRAHTEQREAAGVIGVEIAISLCMRQLTNFAVSVAMLGITLAGGLSLSRRPLSALPEYTEKEKKECDFCHPGGDLFALNEAGRFYAEHHTFEGYETPEGKPAEPAKPGPAKPKPEPSKPKPVGPGKWK